MFKSYISAAIAILMCLSGAASSFATQCSKVDFSVHAAGETPDAFAYRNVIDFNGDGRSDIAGMSDNPIPQSNNVTILMGGDTGTFSPYTLTVSNGTGGLFFGGQWADLNTDGRPDLIGYFSSAPKMMAFFNDGAGSLVSGRSIAFENQYEYVAGTADINADGRTDLITTGPPLAGSDEPTHYLYTSIGDAQFGPRVFIDAEHANVYFGNFDADPAMDLAIVKNVSNSNEYTVKYWLQRAGGSFEQTNSVSIGTFQIDGTGEFNGDGRTDFYGSVNFASMSFLYNDAPSTPTSRSFPAIYKDGSYRMYFGDFNGDGRKDAIDSGRAADATYGYTAYFGDGAGNFLSYTNPFPLNDQNFNNSAVTIDVDRDGRTDIVRVTTDLLNDRGRVDVLRSECVRTGQTTMIDFDGDGKSDQTMWDATSGRWTARLSGNLSESTTFFGNGSLGDIPAPGDFDGDGKTDHAVYRTSTGAWYILRSSDGAMQVVSFGLGTDKPAVADFDGDGKSDITLFREVTGDWYSILSSTGAATVGHFGTQGDRTVQAEFDGDGRADKAIFRPSSGAWYIEKSSDNQMVVTQWGISSDLVVPADYDGDGKADLAVFRPGQGDWYVLRSTSGSMSVTHWGMSGDVPIPFDANGDGTCELNVYRPNESRWYLHDGISNVFGSGAGQAVTLH